METGNSMSRKSKQEYFQVMYERYRHATPADRSRLLDEVCRVCRWHRKHAIRRLNQPLRDPRPRRRSPRSFSYSVSMLSILIAVWRAAGYPWSVRLKALLPLWLPWIRRHFRLTPQLERELLAISPRQMDRRLASHKRRIRRRLYGRTKPGTLLKHQIPIRTTHWDVTQPGYVEVDLVPHSGNSASGEFIFSLNLTDIVTGWVETRAVMGKGQQAVLAALEEMRAALPFPLRGIDSDNGSEFINAHLVRFCQQHRILFTRGRPYKKDDNAHIEQKNWTHVRKVMGWERYDTVRALKAMNEFYRGPWCVMMNLFQPSIKLKTKVRKGSRVTRRYDVPQTPLDRLVVSKGGYAERVEALLGRRARCDPFELAQEIERRLEAIWKMANPSASPRRRHG
jgi:hypothetical protein